MRQCTVLGLLVYELKILREEELIQHLVETDGLGVVDLRRYDVPEEFTKTLDKNIYKHQIVYKT